MSSNNDPVTIPMIDRNPSGFPGMDTSDLNTLTGEAVLSFHNISYQETVQSGFPFCKKTRVIKRLSNISGIMRPGLNAIMGPHGSRSLLLDVLAARKDPRGLSGDILINGKPRPANFKCTSGYVPQNDMVKLTVTVRENIEFSAALRLPMTITRDERRRRIDEVLELLHLDEESNVQPRSKELKKRTSIAMELVTEHPILFLDDPTTDLDLKTTTDVISVLGRMSKRGRTIIFSINQPQYPIFIFFDSLTLVASGKVMYHGPAQEALEYFTSAADKYTELSERQHQVREKLADMYAQSSLYREMRAELDQLLGEQKAGRSSALEEITCVTPFWHQLWWIIHHSFKNFKNFLWITIIWATITFILAVVFGTVFHVRRNDCTEVEDRAILLFWLTVFHCTSSMLALCFFLLDRDQFLHEHTSGYYRMSPYFLGKLLGQLVPRKLVTIIMLLIVFSIAGVKTGVKGFFTMLFTIMMLDYSASSLTLSIGPGETAVAVLMALLVMIYFLFMVLFSDLSLYSGSLGPGLSWIQYLSILHYGFTALQHNEFLGQNFCPEHNTSEISTCPNYVICTGEEFLMIQGIDLSSWGFWKNHVALACIMIIFLSITYVHLLVLKKKRHGPSSRDRWKQMWDSWIGTMQSSRGSTDGREERFNEQETLRS